MITPTDSTDEEIQAALAGEAVRGPRTFRGRELAPISKGLRDLHLKVLRTDDSDEMHDVAFLLILAEAHSSDPSKRLENRARLLLETDNVALFRGRVSLALDELTDGDVVESRRLTDEILGLVKQAQTAIVPTEKKRTKASPRS